MPPPPPSLVAPRLVALALAAMACVASRVVPARRPSSGSGDAVTAWAAACAARFDAVTPRLRALGPTGVHTGTHPRRGPMAPGTVSVSTTLDGDPDALRADVRLGGDVGDEVAQWSSPMHHEPPTPVARVWDRWHRDDVDAETHPSVYVPELYEVVEIHHRAGHHRADGFVGAYLNAPRARDAGPRFAEIVQPVIERCLADAPPGAAAP